MRKKVTKVNLVFSSRIVIFFNERRILTFFTKKTCYQSFLFHFLSETFLLILWKTEYSSRNETSDIIDFYFSYVSTRVHFAHVFFSNVKKKEKLATEREKTTKQIEKPNKREKERSIKQINGTINTNGKFFLLLPFFFKIKLNS